MHAPTRTIHTVSLRRLNGDPQSALSGYPDKAERDVRPVKVQQRTSGGTWRTLAGLADFAVVRSYLSTAAKWGIDALDALTWLFENRPWLPSAAAPP